MNIKCNKIFHGIVHNIHNEILYVEWSQLLAASFVQEIPHYVLNVGSINKATIIINVTYN